MGDLGSIKLVVVAMIETFCWTVAAVVVVIVVVADEVELSACVASVRESTR